MCVYPTRPAAVVAVLAAAFAAAPAAGPALPAVNPGHGRLSQTIAGLDGPGLALASSPTRDELAVGCERGTIQFWDADVVLGVRAGAKTPQSVPAHDGPVVALAWDGGPVLASAGTDQKVCFWNMPSATLLRAVPTPGTVRSLAMSADGKLLAAGTESSGTRVYEVGTGRAAVTLAGLGDWVTALAFSPNGNVIASGTLDGAVDVWETAGGRLLYRAWPKGTPPSRAAGSPPNAVYALAFTPDGKLLASGGADAAVHVLNAADGKPVRALAGHAGAITSLAFHPAGELLASAAKDRTVRLWSAGTGQPLKVLEGHTAWVQSVQFVRRGTRLASTGADQTIRIWDLMGK